MSTTIEQADKDALVAAARAVQRNAYAPYSSFQVGAAILTRSGRVHVGVNVENASYPVGCCAERMAIGAAYAAGERDAIAVAIATDAPTPVMCCGMCAQALHELSPDMLVIASAAGDQRREALVREVLPYAYRGEGLAAGPASIEAAAAEKGP
jgi:cytidine deaminase